MTAKVIRPQSRDLLIDRRFIFRRTDRGIDWITDSYVLARADLFKNAPTDTATSEFPEHLTARRFRRLLDEIRSNDVLPGAVQLTDLELNSRAGLPVAVLRCGSSFLAGVNLSAWTTWNKTGLTPSFNVKGQLLWHGKVRGKRTLFGAVHAIRMGRDHRG